MRKYLLGCQCGALYTFEQFISNDGDCTWCDTDTDPVLLPAKKAIVNGQDKGVGYSDQELMSQFGRSGALIVTEFKVKK